MGKLQIDILGTSFKVQAQEDEEYLKKLLTFYKEIVETVRKSGTITDPIKVSILSGITLVDELYKEKQKTALLKQKLELSGGELAEKTALSLIEKLDKVLQDEDTDE